MKRKLTRGICLFAILAVLSLGVSAAADIAHNAGATAGTQADAKVEKTPPKKTMRPHSHAEEKTGFPQRAAEAMPDKPNATKDRTKHFHPRDGK